MLSCKKINWSSWNSLIIIFTFSHLLEDQAADWEHLIHIYTFTSCPVSGLHASHADGDHVTLLLQRLDFHDSLQQPFVGIVDVATAVVIHTGCSETVAEKPWGEQICDIQSWSNLQHGGHLLLPHVERCNASHSSGFSYLLKKIKGWQKSSNLFH